MVCIVPVLLVVYAASKQNKTDTVSNIFLRLMYTKKIISSNDRNVHLSVLSHLCTNIEYCKKHF